MLDVTPVIPRGPGKLAAALAVLGLMAAGAGALAAMGQPLLCRCGEVALWSGNIASEQNSQQVADPYSFTHVTHGILFFAALWPLRARLAMSSRLIVAIAIEVAWEVLENSPMVIDRYRQATISLGYSGDSVLNSAADVACCLLGFVIAARLPWRLSVALVVLMEVVLAITIRDGLLLNIVMLLVPVPAIREWQLAG